MKFLPDRFLMVLFAALIAAPSISDAQQPRRAATRYQGPAVAPWVGVELGLGAPVARCLGCEHTYGGPALMAAYSVGATVQSRLWLAYEEIGMTVLLADSPNNSRLRVFTARVPVVGDWMVKAGVGEGRYHLGNSRLVDSRLTGIVGFEGCTRFRVEACQFVDYAQSVTTTYGAERYRLWTLRGGMGLRLNILPAKP